MKVKEVKIGKYIIGGNNPIRVQTMLQTPTENIEACVGDIKRVLDAGCEIVRVSVKNDVQAEAIKEIKNRIEVTLVADCHFDYRLAIKSILNGADKIRINPGNMDLKKLKEVIKVASDYKIPIRVGVNAGSLRALKNFDKWPELSIEEWADIMVKEAIEAVELLEGLGFYDIVVSLKADDIKRTVLANRKFRTLKPYPLHIGVTEAGTLIPGLIKTTIAFYELLKDGIGETVRVSLTEDPVLQVRVAFEILKVLGLREYGPEIISCPGCGRLEVELEKIVKNLEKRIYEDPILFKKASGKKIAVMGCVVNGPGEAITSDFGIAGGKEKGVFIEKGKEKFIVKEEEWIEKIIERILKD
ncbi:MAG: flavodoxin-dependent (E)-4-hydroxy-3-methylbut-2-enyl-diphosphate synthase [bacterium]|nr:flavodoxin-dependent (E)-4-hydroxy-3-methylbut-2-enyl-diphosphate synthase [bacterium]